VQRADEPSECDVMIEGLEAAPRLAGRGHIGQSQQNAGDELETKDDQRCAAEYVPPARGVARNRMFRCLADGRGELQTLGPGVGISPA